MANVDHWQPLVDSVAVDDGLPVRACGRWTEEKLWLWHRYLHTTTTSMVGNPLWSGGLTYVDLYAGPGVCVDEERQLRIPGSPLIAANTPKPFKQIVCVELDPARAAACEARLKNSSASARTTVIQGDCRAKIGDVVRLIPDGSLTLAFIDPDGLYVPFSMLQTLATNRPVDFLLLFADAMDLVRNIDRYVSDDNGAKLDTVFGPDSGWRSAWDKLQNRSGSNICSLFVSIFTKQVQRRLGYEGVREKIVKGPGGRPLYRLLYASKHRLGLKFWDGVTAREIGGQGRLGFYPRA